MASTEQPLKKRKLYCKPAPEPPPPVPRPPPLIQQQTQKQGSVDPSLSQDEIQRRQRNQEEIRSLFESYKRIKRCISRKEGHLMPDLEQSYLALITASRGCRSVQRLVADLVPRYASYCPTALEAAAKVIINVHNWNLAYINRGDDADGVAFETAKACIFGLADICETASLEAPTSSVIQGICSAVFLYVLTFLISSFEGKDIFQIVDIEALEIQNSTEFFEFAQKFSDENQSVAVKLSKFRALSLLKIFFCCPRKTLAACFELVCSSAPNGGHKEGLYFLSQVNHRLNIKGQFSDGNQNSAHTSTVKKTCLLGQVLTKDPSIRRWIISKYKELSVSSSPEALSDISSALEGAFESFSEMVKLESEVHSDRDDTNSSRLVNGKDLVSRGDQPETSEVPGGDCDSRVPDKPDKSLKVAFLEKSSGQHLKPCSSLVSLETDLPNETSDYNNAGSECISSEAGEQGELARGRSSTPRELLNHQIISPSSRSPSELSNSSKRRNLLHPTDNYQVPKLDSSTPSSRPSTGNVNKLSESPKQYGLGQYPSTTSHSVWFSDGDFETMDIFPASKQLWLGPLGPDASEALVRFQFEKFGPIEELLYFQFKDFALIAYRYIMDAVKARQVMRGQTPWGACLRIKFLDKGLGTRGVVNGTAVGSSCQVYVGNTFNQWTKDEILQESAKVVYKSPLMVTDLAGEGALLLEFENPEEAAIVMGHLRQHYKEKNFGRSSNIAAVDVNRPMDVSRSESPADNYNIRMSRLASLLSSFRTKYNINQYSSYGDYHRSGNNMSEKNQVPSSTLWISIPSMSSLCLTGDELKTICELAIGKPGTIIKLTQTDAQIGSSWFVECSSLDAAKTLLTNLRGCPMIFFHIEFSQSGEHHTVPVATKPERRDIPQARVNPENHGSIMQSGHSFQPNWTPEVRARHIDSYDHNAASNPLTGGGHVVSGFNDQTWVYKKPETEHHPVPGNQPFLPTAPQPLTVPPPPYQSSPFLQPIYFPPTSSWDGRSFGHHHPLPAISPGGIPSYPHTGSVAVPYRPASVTPLAQMQAGFMQHPGQMFPLPAVPPLVAPLPPQPSMPPPLSLPLPPLPHSQLPPVPPPPPPTSPPLAPPPPPPPSAGESSHLRTSGLHQQYQWHGALCKSGVHYCNIYADRVDSDACKYSNAVTEPAEWPPKLDMSKRTDFRHVKSTFSSTPSHKREVCLLFPSSESDRKGFQDFITYLKQRECAGVIKIPSSKPMWSRILFILPHSADACSMLSIPSQPSDCLIALVLPKETNAEWL